MDKRLILICWLVLGLPCTHAALQDTAVYSDIAYFAFDAPNRIERFDFNTDAWLSALPMDEAPTALAVDDSGLYIAADTSLLKFSLTGTNKTPIGTTTATTRSSRVIKLVSGTTSLKRLVPI